MANEFARNLQDNAFKDASFTLSATTGTAAASDIFDLGADTYKPENLEAELTIVALPAGVVVTGTQVLAGVETSTSSTFGSTDRVIADVLTGASGLAAQTLRYRLPSNCARYVRGYVNITAYGATGGASAATYTGSFAIKV
jgi:hypothetical protein